MSAVRGRCIGTEDEQLTPWEFIAGAPPCGWQGEVHGLDSRQPYEIESVRINPAVLVKGLHCPWCSTGRVELIGEDQGKP